MTSFSISMPSSSSRSTPSPTQYAQPTNTVAVAGVPKAFFHPVILDVLRDHFSSFGEINRWVPLPGFGRIIVVYRFEDNAEHAKQDCDPIVVQQSHDGSDVVLRVYRADPNPLMTEDMFGNPIPEANYLRPPSIDKNFLISPPGSPPVGWEQIKEDPPNPTPLADDLIQALRRLQMHEKRSSVEVLLDPQEGSGVGVYVEDCGGEEVDEVAEEAWVYGETAPARTKWKPIATAMPPLRAIAV
ncbi:putative calcipressin [Lyophyllum shimeji]|uniref:Calcipressin n=1 Tax=Lyophyllum shimeji TaxID=47721 RepID=A0A9P3PHJ0_LYOSH|nr:putative calcipressin [Lyophyllum shimeji]